MLRVDSYVTVFLCSIFVILCTPLKAADNMLPRPLSRCGHDFDGAILVQPADAVVAATSKLLPHNFQTRGRNNRHRLPTVGRQQVAVTKNMKRDTPSLPDQSPFIKNSRYK